MKYINQLEYPHIPYRTHAKIETVSETDRMKSVARSGCGPCSVCMMLELLTEKTLDIEECIRISEECGANHSVGTDMTILGPVIAEKYGVVYTRSSDLNEAIGHIQCGGVIVVHVTVQQGAEIGLYTKGGHYMLLVATDGKEFCFLDPSYTPEKYLIPERIGKVDVSHAPYLYSDVEILHSETNYKEGGVKYHMFARKR